MVGGWGGWVKVTLVSVCVHFWDLDTWHMDTKWTQSLTTKNKVLEEGMTIASNYLTFPFLLKYIFTVCLLQTRTKGSTSYFQSLARNLFFFLKSFLYSNLFPTFIQTQWCCRYLMIKIFLMLRSLARCCGQKPMHRLCGDLMLAADEMSSRRSLGDILTDIVIVQFGSPDQKHPV